MDNTLPLLINSYFNTTNNSNTTRLFRSYNRFFHNYINETFNNPIDNSINNYSNDILELIENNIDNNEIMNEISSLLTNYNNLYNTDNTNISSIDNNVTSRSEELDYKILKKKYYLKSILISNKNKIECGICLDYVNDTGYQLDCKHIYHKDCIKKWIKIKPSCPLCREELNYKT